MRPGRFVDLLAIAVLFVALTSGLRLAAGATNVGVPTQINASILPGATNIKLPGQDISANTKCGPIIKDCACGYILNPKKTKPEDPKCIKASEKQNMNGCKCKSTKQMANGDIVPVEGKCVPPDSKEATATGGKIEWKCAGQVPAQKPPANAADGTTGEPPVPSDQPKTGPGGSLSSGDRSAINDALGGDDKRVISDAPPLNGPTASADIPGAQVKPGQLGSGEDVAPSPNWRTGQPPGPANATVPSSAVNATPPNTTIPTNVVSSGGPANIAGPKVGGLSAGPTNAPISANVLVPANRSVVAGLEPSPVSGSLQNPTRPISVLIPANAYAKYTGPTITASRPLTTQTLTNQISKTTGSATGFAKSTYNTGARAALTVFNAILSFIPGQTSNSTVIVVPPPIPKPLPQNIEAESVIYTTITSCPPGKPCKNVPIAVNPPGSNSATSSGGVPHGASVCVIDSSSFLHITGGNSNTCTSIVTPPSPMPTPSIVDLVNALSGSNAVKPVASVNANPATAQKGGSTTLSWQSIGTTACSLYQGDARIAVGDSNGSILVKNLVSSVTFSVWCITNASDQVRGQTTVFVN